MEEFTPMTALDRIADGSGLQMLKASIPYFPIGFQRSLSLYIKLIEVENVLSYYQNPIQACAVSNEEQDPEDMLSEIKKYGTKSQQESVEQLLQLLHTLKMYQTCKELL
ncbi:MAG: hypothetical protein Q4B57_04300 [Eubacteriales bacterium]|nr:hypothetical protein [Eubacteriales bacterium]